MLPGGSHSFLGVCRALGLFRPVLLLLLPTPPSPGLVPSSTASAPTGAEGQSPTSRLRPNLLCILNLLIPPLPAPQRSLPSLHTRERNIQLLPKSPGFRRRPRLLSPFPPRNCRTDAAEPSHSPDQLQAPCRWPHPAPGSSRGCLKGPFPPQITQRDCPS